MILKWMDCVVHTTQKERRRKMKVRYYKDKRDKIRWRVVAENGEIVGSSSQGFANRKLAKSNAAILAEALSE